MGDACTGASGHPSPNAYQPDVQPAEGDDDAPEQHRRVQPPTGCIIALRRGPRRH